MSVAGIDFGNLSLLIGQTSKGGVDVILNESSNRQTATSVSIQGKQRFIGDSGAAMVRILNSLLFIDQNEAYRYNFIFIGQV
jgi:molecular chaperone DnaK (HSP70)